MSFSSSDPVKIPLADPLIKYGKTFRVSNALLSSAGGPQTSYNLPAESSELAVYQQNFSTENLRIDWSIIDPRTSYIYSKTSDIERNPYVSGFNINVYKNSGQLTGANAISSRGLVDSQSGINGNSFSYIITGGEDWRNYSIDIEFIDFTGNKSVGMLSTQNPEPNYSILSTGVNNGVFSAGYSGLTGDGGRDSSNGLQALVLYDFTGLSSGESGYFTQDSGYLSQAKRISVGSNGSVAIELEPGQINYIMQVSQDQYSTGSQSGFYSPIVYATGIGFSGASGDLTAPLPIYYMPQTTNLTGYRISGGNAYYYTFDVNYPTGSDLLNAVYEVTGSGLTSGAESGYTGQIFLDKGLLYNVDYGAHNTGTQYFYDNSLDLQSGLFTGITTQMQTVTGVGFSGSGLFGIGAGAYWKDSCPIYEAYELSGSGGFYGYGYFDATSNEFGCASFTEVASGIVKMPGMFSMPKDDPNSYEIKFRSGENFRGSYERGAAFLNEIGEMPAVIVNPSQFNKIRSMDVPSGWVGLRRGKVGLLTGLFSENSINQELFNSTNFLTGESRDISVVNSLGVGESSEIRIGDVGSGWAWTNASGTHIYKLAGTGYEKVREAHIGIELSKVSDGEILNRKNFTAIAPAPDISSLTFSGSALDSSIHISYTFKNSYYSETVSSPPLTPNYNINRVNLYTGASPGFSIAESNLYTGYSDSIAIQEGISYSQDLNEGVPGYFKLVPYDDIGSGVETGNQVEFFVKATNQSIVISLDPQFYGTSSDVNVVFPMHSPYSHPNVTQTLSYTGTLGPPTYIGGMLNGAPTASGAEILLTAPPSATGYVLYVEVT